VVELLQDELRRRALGEAGLAFARGHDWSAIVPLLEGVYLDLGRVAHES